MMMPKRFSLWITLAAIMLTGAAGCASHNATPPAAEAAAPAPAVNPPPAAYQGGFQGIGCGSPPSADMKLVRTAGDIKFYTRQGEPLGVGSAHLKQPTLYRFWQDQFEGAMLQTSGPQNNLAMLGYFQSIIGPGKLQDPAANRRVWSDSSLVVIYEQIPDATQDASVVVGCRAVQQKHQAAVTASQGH
jgi:hypothetical protein